MYHHLSVSIQAQADDIKFIQSATFEECFPSSEKVYVEVTHNDELLKVPMRRVILTGGAGHLDLQDTSGAQVLYFPFICNFPEEPSCKCALCTSPVHRCNYLHGNRVV